VGLGSLLCYDLRRWTNNATRSSNETCCCSVHVLCINYMLAFLCANASGLTFIVI